MSDDLDQFLLRAAQLRQRRAAAPPPRRRAAPPPRRTAPGPAPAADVKDVEIVSQTTAGGQLGTDVARQVGRYLDTSEFDARAAELGEEVESAEEQLERRIEQEFDHQVGRLAGRPPMEKAATAEPAPTPSTARDIALLLRDPQDLQRAIVLNEILSRPEGRW